MLRERRLKRNGADFALSPLRGFGSDLMKTAKEQSIDSISRLPAEATWQDIIYCLYVRRKIEEGIKAAKEGRLVSHEEVKRLFARKQ